MSSCINTKSAEFRTLKERSGLSDFTLDVLISNYQDQHNGEWPKLDEIPGANSEEALKKDLKLRKDNSTSIKSILEATGTQDLQEALYKINDNYRDVTTDFTKVSDLIIVNIERRPSPFEYHPADTVDVSSLNSTTFIGQSLEQLQRCFGIETIPMSARELKEAGLLEAVPEGVHAAAFIHEGNIYVNTDVASVNAPVHELMHVLLGSIKFTNPELYKELVSYSLGLSNYGDIAELYQHRAQSDVNEEVFAEEYSKFLSGMDSEFSQLDPELIYKVNYEISRTLDTILNGSDSVRAIPTVERFSATLKELGVIVNSKNMENKFLGYLDSARVHRIMANVKTDMFKKGELEEICD